MALKLSQAEAMDVYNKAENALARAKKAMLKADEAIDVGVHAIVTTGTAFGFGVAQGRYGGIEIVGVPADLAAGLLAHVGGFLGIGGKAAPYLHAVGNGGLACYAATMGRGVGDEWRAKAITGGGETPALPEGAAASGHTMSRAELERLAHSAV